MPSCRDHCITPARRPLVPRLPLRRPGALPGAARGARPGAASSPAAGGAGAHGRPRAPGSGDEGAAPLRRAADGREGGRARKEGEEGRRAKPPPLSLGIPALPRSAPSPSPAARPGRFSCVTSSCPAALGSGCRRGSAGACALRSAPSGHRGWGGLEGKEEEEERGGLRAHTRHPAPLASGARGSAGRGRAGRKAAAEGPARAAGSAGR